MTNESGKHSYLYEMKLYETVNQKEVPIAIGFNSYINDTNAFKALLYEAYLIITSQLSYSNKEFELMNYLMFIYSLKIPPMHSLLSVNLLFSSADFYFNSQSEIPTVSNDFNVNILFSVLELRKIIKLWFNVLLESKIIIYGDNFFLLHAIIDAITKLIFPFTYPCTIISTVPKPKLDLLDLPCPYLIGLQSSTVPIEQLIKRYPNICIVDLHSGRIYSPKIDCLPQDKEIRIKKQIQYVTNPKLFQETEVFYADQKKYIDIDTIDPNADISTNIKQIFFKFMKEALFNYSEYINKENQNKFNFNLFLSSIQNEDMRITWEKIIKTNTFFLFFSDGKYLDDWNNTKIFNNIISKEKQKSEKQTIKNCFQIKMSLNKVNINKIKEQMNDISFNNIIDEQISIFNKVENNNQSKQSFPQFKFYSKEGFISFAHALSNQCSLIGQSIANVFINTDYINGLYTKYQNIRNDIPRSINIANNDINDNNQLLKLNKPNDDSLIDQNQKDKLVIKEDQATIILNLLDKDCLSKLYLFFAFNLPHKEFNEDILNYYHKAFQISEINFPYYRYYTYIQNQNYSLEQLEKIAKEISGIELKMIIEDCIKSKRHTPLKTNFSPFQLDKKVTMPNSTKNKPISCTTINKYPIYDENNLRFTCNNETNSIDVTSLEKMSEQMKKEFISQKSHKQLNLIKDIILSKKDGESNDSIVFDIPRLLNIQSKVSKISNTTELMTLIAKKINELIIKSNYSLKAIYSEMNKDLLKEIKSVVNKLQKVNLAKLFTANENYSFWLNAFNFLLIYSIIITQFKPKTFNDWNIILKNSLYKIGGYEISLHEIDHLILNGPNLHQEPITFTDPFMEKFSLLEYNILIDCALYFPIDSTITSLVVFHSEQFLKQIEDITNDFFNKNIKFDSENNVLTMSSYLLLLFPNFVSVQYKQFKNHLSNSLFEIINAKKYAKVVYQQINWETLFK